MDRGQTITIHYEVWDGDITPLFLAPMPQTGIAAVAQTRIEQGRWVVSSEDGGVPFAGTGDNRHEAITNYLLARLGWSGEEAELPKEQGQDG
jgi:hypothetical protein